MVLCRNRECAPKNKENKITNNQFFGNCIQGAELFMMMCVSSLLALSYLSWFLLLW